MKYLDWYWNTWLTKGDTDTPDAFYLSSHYFSFYIHFYPFHWWFWYWSLKPFNYQTAFAKVEGLRFRLPTCEFEFSFIM